MKELIHKIWLAGDLDEDSYRTWKDDDEGRLQIIYDRIDALNHIRADVSRIVDSLLASLSRVE